MQYRENIYSYFQSSVNLSYSGTFYGLAPGDYIIINHGIDYQPDQVYTTSGTIRASFSASPLTSSSNNGDWYYDNSTHIFSYIGNTFLYECTLILMLFFFMNNLVKNPSTNTIPIDVVVPVNIIKCRYPNCQAPVQPCGEVPATQRPSTAVYWSNDSSWGFASQGYGGYGKF